MERKRSQDYLTVGFVPAFDLEVKILWGFPINDSINDCG